MRKEPPLRAAVVGAGLIGAWHADSVTRAGEEIVVVVDPDVDRARDLAKRHAGALVESSLERALDSVRIDVVHICSPGETHFDLTRAALRAGCHVLVEKPLASTARATAELLQLAEASDRLLCPVHQFLFQPGVSQTLERLADMGRIRHIDSIVCSAGAADEDERRHDEVAFEILPHPLALFARLLPVSLEEVAWRVARVAPGELRAVGRMDGATAGILISMSGRPTRNELRIIGESATARVDLFHGYSVVESGRVARARKIVRPFSLSVRTFVRASTNLGQRALRAEPAYPGLRELIRRFYEAAREGGEPPIPVAETLAVARARDELTRLAGETSAAPG